MFCSRLALSLPQVVTFGNNATITYFYAADGTKVRTVHVINGATTQTDYCGNVIYENGAQKLLQTEEGYYDFVNGGYCYYLKDHQGNNRVVINGSGAVKETNHYYPFGGLFAGTSVQPFKYNGKEFDGKNGLNWYDYGARHYDATLGRWHVVDPLADKYYKYSPYTYCANSPLLLVDPDGQSFWSILIKGGRKVAPKIAKEGLSTLGKVSTYEEAFSEIFDDAETLFDSEAPTEERIIAGLSLVSETLPISFKDFKAIGKIQGVVHGNSKQSTKAQHAYDIVNKGTGKVAKTGVSGTGTRKSDGKSKRAEKQVREWNKEVGYEKYESTITHEEPTGEGARDYILKYEEQRSKYLREKGELKKINI